ncbi:lipase, partial [Streptomyces sp. NPDC088135]
MNRRTLLTSCAGLVTAATIPGPLASAAVARPQREEPVRFQLPAPSGPYPLGTVAFHLVDTTRPDPWVPSRPRRELMISIWDPARGGSA